MDDELFTQLFESVKHMDETVRGKRRPSRANRFEETNVKSIREKTGLSQSQFALIIGVKLKTLQNWEQGRRKPVGPARALLKIFQADPERAIKALHGELPRKNLGKINGY
jgi:putative transcriptional regulator